MGVITSTDDNVYDMWGNSKSIWKVMGSNINLTRIIHPVGFGLFVTESFSVDQQEINVIYDCGHSSSKKTTTHLEGIVDQYFNSLYNKHIDYLFISHFDNDHINGISYLIRKGYLNRNSHIVLPLFDSSIVYLYENIYSYLYRDLILVFIILGCEISYIIPEGSEPEETLGGNIYYNGKSFPLLNMMGMIFWEFIPLTIQDKSIYSEFKTYLVNHPNYNSIYKKVIGKSPLTDKEREILKTAYKNFKMTKSVKSGNVTSINMNAMMLISKKTSPVNPNNSSTNNPNAFYTSDVSLKPAKVQNKISAYLSKFLNGHVGLFQVPHHGSKHCYSDWIFTLKIADKYFCNGKNSSRRYYTGIDTDATNSSCQYFVVDENPANILLDPYTI